MRPKRYLFCRSRAITVFSAALPHGTAPGFHMNPSSLLRNQPNSDRSGAPEIDLQRAIGVNSRFEGAIESPVPTRQLPAERLVELLDPTLWREGSEHYALATRVAVQLFDAQGKPIGECFNPQPLCSVLQSRRAAEAGCAFFISPKNCTCISEACRERNTVFVRDYVGLVHFAVPLLLEDTVLGCLVAGQVFDQYPETLALDRAARDAGLSPQHVWKIARRAHPIGIATLKVYADLLTTLGNALLQARYKSILEAERMEHLRQAQKRESIGILAGGVAHDFNNLLTGILGNASLIVSEVSSGDAVRSRAEEICNSAQRAAGLTRQLLAYSGQGTFVIEPIDLSALVRDMSDLIHLTTSKGVSLQFELPESLPAIEADASQIQQIIMNLVINAAESIGVDEHGTVVVHNGVHDLDSEQVQSIVPKIEPGQYVFLEVRDNGCGMDEGVIKRIFDPFFTTKFTGRGLGLAAVWGIVRAHNGAMEVRSVCGQGTIFKVLFRASAKVPRRVRTSLDSIEHPRGSGTILVVDDEAVVRQVAKAALERFGYTVELADNGETAIQLFQNAAESFSLVLLDMTMPGLSGLETFLQLKRVRPAVKVLLSSGYNEVEATRRFEGEGLAGFIQKPYTAPALDVKIQDILRNG